MPPVVLRVLIGAAKTCADSEALQVLFGNASRDADVMAFVELP